MGEALEIRRIRQIKVVIPRRGSGTLMAVYQAALLVLALALAFAVQGIHPIRSSLLVVVLLGAAAAVGERARVRIGISTETSVSLLPTVFAAAVFGPLAGLIVAGASYLGDFPPFMSADMKARAAQRGSPYLKWGIYTCIRAIYGGIAGLAAGWSVSSIASTTAQVVVATFVAAVVAGVLDQVFAAFTFYLRGGSARDSFRASMPAMLASVPMYAPVVALLGVAYVEFSAWVLPLFLGPTLAAQRLFALYQEQRRLADDLGTVNEDRLEDANLSFATRARGDARRPGPLHRRTLGRSGDLCPGHRKPHGAERGHQQRLAFVCGLVHDIGKIGLHAGLLEKPGALTLDERREMQKHSEIGEGILARVATYAEIAGVVRHHHERVDGMAIQTAYANLRSRFSRESSRLLMRITP